ncbi:MAG: flagellar hook-associated protein FlgL [Planctomycetota bacterium]|jgi:flagellar hook-associated protein 3
MGTLNGIFSNASFALNMHTKALATLQEQTYTGSRINRTSDDPSAAYRVLGLESQQRVVANYMDNISEATSSLEMSADVLLDMTTAITETTVNLTQILSGTYGLDQEGQEARSRLAQQIDDILESMVSSANTKHIDQHLFGGTSTGAPPYAVVREDGEIVSATYVGSREERTIEVAAGIQTDIFYSGEDIFSADNRGEPEFYGTTGAATGSGTSNVKGDAWLTVTHDGTNYRLSIDDGATEVVVPLAGDISNIAVTDANGQVLYVDATNITQTGVERIRVPGTYNLFDTLISARDLLKNEKGLDGDTIVDLIEKSSESLNEVKNVLIEKQVTIGTKINFLDTLRENLDNIKFGAEEEATGLEQADIAQIAIDIARREALYQMSLSMAGKLMSISLLDFI